MSSKMMLWTVMFIGVLMPCVFAWRASIGDMVGSAEPIDDGFEMFDLWEDPPGSSQPSRLWKKNWDGCPAEWMKINDAETCKKAARAHYAGFGLDMVDENWGDDVFVAGRGLNHWPHGCVVNKASKRAYFNDQPRPGKEKLRFKFAKGFRVVCQSEHMLSEDGDSSTLDYQAREVVEDEVVEKDALGCILGNTFEVDFFERGGKTVHVCRDITTGKFAKKECCGEQPIQEVVEDRTGDPQDGLIDTPQAEEVTIDEVLDNVVHEPQGVEITIDEPQDSVVHEPQGVEITTDEVHDNVVHEPQGVDINQDVDEKDAGESEELTTEAVVAIQEVNSVVQQDGHDIVPSETQTPARTGDVVEKQDGHDIVPSQPQTPVRTRDVVEKQGPSSVSIPQRPRPTSRSFDPDLARRTFLGSGPTINTLFSGSDNGSTRRHNSKTLFNRGGSGGEANTHLAANIGSQPFNPAHYRQGSKHAHRSSGDLQPALRNESVDKKYVAYADYRKIGPVSSRCRSVLRTFQAGDGLRTLVNACGAEGPCKFCHSAGNRNLDVCQAVRAKAPTVYECRSLKR